MSTIPYAFRVTDDSGALVSGATLTIAGTAATVDTPVSVTPKKLSDLTNFGAPVSVTYHDGGAGDYVLAYDPEAGGEALFEIAPTKGGSTITKGNALIPVVATKDSSRVLTSIPIPAPAATGGLPIADSSGAVLLSSGTGLNQISLVSGKVLLQASQSGVTIPTVTTLTNAPSDSSGVTTLLGNLTTLLGRITGSIAPTTGDAFARLGAPAGASVSADIAQVEGHASLADSQSATAAAGTASIISTLSGLVASIWTYATRTLSAFSFGPTNWASQNINSSGCVLLQPSQPSVVIPTVTTLTNAPADTSGITTLLTRIPSALTISSGGVTVAGYASGQDPFTLLMAGSYLTIPGNHTTTGTGEVLTFKQWMALIDAMAGGDNVSTAPVANSTYTVTYYLRGASHISANIVAVATVSLDANKNQTGRTDLVAQPFPAVN